jgi:small subunit ribosomal protein S6
LEVKRIYEAMFLFDPTAAGSWEHVEEVVKRLLERANAELIRIKKWDERRLAYEIEGRKRGTFVLCFFNAPTEKIAGLERDVQLSDEIIRALVLRRDKYTIEKVNEIADKSQGYAPESPFGSDERPEREERGGRFVKAAEAQEVAGEEVVADEEASAE